MTASRFSRFHVARRPFLAGLAAALTAPAGCTKGAYTQVLDIWRADVSPTFRRMLVVGIWADQGRRSRVEGRTAVAFNNARVPAMSADTLTASAYPYERPALMTVTADNELDGALVIRLVSYDQTATVDVTGEPQGDTPRAKWDLQLRHAYNAEGVAPLQVARAETTLFEVATEKLVWSGLSETFAPDNMDEALASYGHAMVQALIERNLVAPG